MSIAGTLVTFLDHWQTLLAGVLALIAAGITLYLKRRNERRKVAARRPFISVALSKKTLMVAKIAPTLCFTVTAVNVSRRPVEVRKLAIRLKDGQRQLFLDDLPLDKRLPRILEEADSVSATLEFTDLHRKYGEKFNEDMGKVTLVGICVDSFGKEFTGDPLDTSPGDFLNAHANN
jgi:hypothetical protein